MIKRPLNSQFSKKVRDGIKITTIRNKPWPIGVPIMLYNWMGAAYRSKHKNVAVIKVAEVRTIRITHKEDGDILYAYGATDICGKRIHETEGFDSRKDMDAWFRPLVKMGQTAERSLMYFSLVNDIVQEQPAEGEG